MSADPVTVHSAGSDINPYSYGYSNPTAYVDPDGRNPLVVIFVAAIIAGATSATVQYATTGHIKWGLDGVAGAALAGAFGGAAGMMVGAGAGALGAGAIGSAAIGGAAGGAYAGYTGTLMATGRDDLAYQSAITGAVSGAVGGGIGVAAGSASSSVGASMAGASAGTASGTMAGVMFGAAVWGEDPTWQSAGTAFATAFAGTIASSSLSYAYQAATEQTTAGRAAGQAAGRSARRASDAVAWQNNERETARLAAAIDAYDAGHMLADNTLDPRQLETIRQNVEAVRQAEWELFYALSGAKLVKMAWGAFEAWRAARVATRGAAVFGGACAGAAERGLGRALQTGGNTIQPRTAKALNEALGFDLHPREWGRALEALKADFNLANDFHGVITESGAYLNKAGKAIGNLMDYLP